MYNAVCQSVRGLLASNGSVGGLARVLLIDKEGLRIVNDYVTFSELLELGYIDVVLLKPGQPQLLNKALRYLNVTVVVENTALVESEVLGDNSPVESFDLIIIGSPNERVLQKLARKDCGTKSRIARVLETSVNYCCLPNGLFHCYLDRKVFPKSPIDWSTADYNTVNEAVKILTNFCIDLSAVEAGSTAPGEPFIITPQNSKTASTVSSLLTEGLRQRKTVNCGSLAIVLLDRYEDPITPLLLPWTYLGMIYEYLNVTNNAVLLRDCEINLSFKNDNFFQANHNKSFGELASLLSVIETTLPTSIKDFEAAKKARTELDNHSRVVHELTSIFKDRSIFDIWDMEQKILQATSLTKNEMISAGIKELLARDDIDSLAIDRLVSLIKAKCSYILQEDPPIADWAARVPDPDGSPLIETFYQNVTYKVANRFGISK